MVKGNLVRVLSAAALIIALPAAAAAQTEDASPEGIEWHLGGYAVDGEVGIVPWYIDATLLLEDGTASGSTGCNRFSGGYTLEGQSLTFDPAVTMTRMACPQEETAVEDGYMTALPRTASWVIEDGWLSLTDDLGEPLLDFEQAVVDLTPSDLAAIRLAFTGQQAQIDRLDERLDSVRIGLLRERIRDLESAVKRLRSQAASSGNGSSSAFSAAEQALLKGVPGNIRSTCKPLRGSNLPRGTVAAVQCQPNTTLVSEMAYYLMDYPAGRRTFNTVMRSNSVPERHRCPDGRASQMLLHPNSGEGCFVKGGNANVRLMYMASSCSQMDAGSTHLESPVIYVAIEGSGGNIKPLWNWTRDRDGGSAVTRDIPTSGQPITPVCDSPF